MKYIESMAAAILSPKDSPKKWNRSRPPYYVKMKIMQARNSGLNFTANSLLSSLLAQVKEGGLAGIHASHVLQRSAKKLFQKLHDSTRLGTGGVSRNPR